MGSQTEVRKKLKPNLWRGRVEARHQTKNKRGGARTTEAANRNVIMRAISSPWRRRERNEREPATGPALGTEVVVVATYSARGTGSCRSPLFPLLPPPLGALRR